MFYELSVFLLTFPSIHLHVWSCDAKEFSAKSRKLLIQFLFFTFPPFQPRLKLSHARFVAISLLECIMESSHVKAARWETTDKRKVLTTNCLACLFVDLWTFSPLDPHWVWVLRVEGKIRAANCSYIRSRAQIALRPDATWKISTNKLCNPATCTFVPVTYLCCVFSIEIMN